MHPDDGLDELAGSPASRWSTPAAAVALVLVAALVALGIAGHEPHARHTTAPVPKPTRVFFPDPVPVAQTSRGSVFLAHLPQCTAGAASGRLTVALGVINLSDRPLRLVRSVPLNAGRGLAFTAARVGAPPCAAHSHRRSAVLAPSEHAVVTMSFRVIGCPRSSGLAARVMFVIGNHITVHADSSQLADLSRLPFAGCA